MSKSRSSTRETPLYRAWCVDAGETDEDGAANYGALDVACAAKLHANYRANRGDYESWPKVLHVRDPDGSVWVVEVDRELVAEYIPGKPLPLVMAQACHAIWSGRVPLCEDARLRGHWPDDQKFIKLDEIMRGAAKVEDISCEKCRRRAPGIITGLTALKESSTERKRGA